MSDINSLQKEVEELTKLMRLHVQKDQKVIGNINSLKWLQGIITILVVVVGVGVNWGITITKVGKLENKVYEVEKKQEQIAERQKEAINKLESDMKEVQLKQARDDQLLITIQNTLNEVKNDVKKMVKK